MGKDLLLRCLEKSRGLNGFWAEERQQSRSRDIALDIRSTGVLSMARAVAIASPPVPSTSDVPTSILLCIALEENELHDAEPVC